MSVTVLPRKVLFTNVFDPDSSVIDRVYYDGDNKELWVVTKTGDRYGYTNVPRYSYDSFAQAHSAGAYWNKNIKGWYTTTRENVTFEKKNTQKLNWAAVTAVPNVAVPARKFVIRAEVSASVEIEVNANSVDDAVLEFYKRLTDAGLKESDSKIKEVAQRFDS